jgi:site-specific recombinase XerD
MEIILQKLRDDMKICGLSPLTQEAYVRFVKKYAEFIQKPVTEAGEQDSKRFLLFLHEQRGLCPSTRNQYAAALRFLYVMVLNQGWARERIKNARCRSKLPEVLSGSEVLAILRSFDSLKHKAIALLCYGAGLRIGEAISLRPEDIDSKRGVIYVRRGKGSKDRLVCLSPRLLKHLRFYWRTERPRGAYLFPGWGKAGHITKEAFSQVLRAAVIKSGVKKRVTPHLLRHTYATHCIESGVDLRSLQILLGHAYIESTAHYVRLTEARRQTLKSPLELLAKPEGAVLG